MTEKPKRMLRKSVEKNFEELCNLFYSNIPLFVQKQDFILNDPRFCSIRSPKVFYSGAHIGNCFSTLGKMLMFWKNETRFSEKCNCGGKTVVYHFGISNLSGCIANKICLKCGKLLKTPYSFKYSFKGLHKYKWNEDDYCEPVAIAELVNYLKDENHQINTLLKDYSSYVPLYLTHSVWKEEKQKENLWKYYHRTKLTIFSLP